MSPGRRYGIVGILLVAIISVSSFSIHRYIVNDRIAEHAVSVPAADGRVARLDSVLAMVMIELQSKPNDSMLIVSAANMAYDLGRFDTAATLYQRFLADIDPGNTPVKIDYGYTLFMSGHPERGMAVIEGVIESEPRNQTAMYNIAILYARSGDFLLAKEWMERCITADSTSGIASNARDVLSRIESTENN